jgi:membrane dipeptidase
MRIGGASACFYSIFVPDFFVKGSYKTRFKNPIIKRFSHYKGKPFSLALSMIDRLHKEIDRHNDIKLALTSKDLLNNRHRISGLIGLEGAHPLEGRVDRVKVLYDKGVRYIGITWNNSNSFADAAGHSIHGGLSKLGRILINKMMSLGILIDLSHASDNTFYDVLSITKDYPVILSHSTARSLVKHKRNISDSMIRALKSNGGIIGVIYHSKYLRKKGRANIEDVLNHIDYLVELSSIDNVALGSDYDGFIKTPTGLENISKLPSLTLGLYNRGYSFEDIKKILGANFIRVFKKVESFKHRNAN